MKSEGIDVVKSNNSKECRDCHYWYFNHGFKFHKFVRNGCRNLLMLYLNITDTTTIPVKIIDYRCIIHYIGKSDAIHLLKYSVFDDCEYVQNAFERNQYEK